MNEPYDNVVAALNAEIKRRREAEEWAERLRHMVLPFDMRTHMDDLALDEYARWKRQS